MGAAVEPIGELLPGLGARLRLLRNRNGWTLEELSLRTELSEPFLSRLESGRRQPSLAALITLARAYSIPLAALLDETPSSSAPVVIRAGSTPERWASGLQYRVASGNSPNVNLHAIHVTVPPKREHEAFYRHEGEEWLHVLSGRLRLIFEDAEHVLKLGDSAHFEAATPHRLAAIGPQSAEVVVVSCSVPQSPLLLATDKAPVLKMPQGKKPRRASMKAITGPINHPLPPQSHTMK
jgi:transcriptional regulator with XRE-family HTH domain